MSLQSAPPPPPSAAPAGAAPASASGSSESLVGRLVGAALFVALLAAQERRILGELEPPALPPMLNSFALPLLLAGLTLFLRERTAWVLLGLLGVLLSAMFTFDMGALRYFRQPVGLEMAAALPQMVDASESASTLASPLEWAYTGIFAMLGLIGWLAARRRGAGRPGLRRLVALACLVTAAIPLGPTLQIQRQPRSIFDLENPGTRFAREHGLGPYHLWDAVDSLRRRFSRASPDPERMDLIGAVFAHKKSLNDITSPFAGLARGRNVILVQLEAVQQFALDHVGPEGPTMPFLRSLSAQHLGFADCMDSTRIGRTSDGEFVVLTGLLPHPRAAVALTYPDNDWIALPKLLADDGYATLSLHAFRPDFWNRVVTHPAYGIESMRFQQTFKPGRNLAWGLSDEEFFPQAAVKLAGVERPFMALLISLSSHHPFNVVPKELLGRETGMPASSMVEGYLRLCHYTDQALEGFFAALSEQGLLQDSVIVIYGDHDAGLDADSRAAVAEILGRDLDHPREDKVPLVIALPGEEAFLAEHRDAVVDTVGGLHDITPTVLHLLGREIPEGLFGTHLFVPTERRDVLPLHRGGFVAEGRVHSPLDSRSGSSPEDIAQIDEWARASWAAEQLAATIIEYDAQRTARASRPGQNADALLAQAQRGGRPESIDPWTVQREDLSDIPAGPWGQRSVSIGIPSSRMGFALELQLRNDGAGPARYRVESRGRAGNALAVQTGVAQPGVTDIVVVPVDPPGADELAAYAVIDHEPGLRPRGSLKHAFGPDVRPVETQLSRRTVVSGPGAQIDKVHVLVVNPTGRPARTTVRLIVGGATVRQRPVNLPPAAFGAVMLPLPENAQATDIEIVVEGDPVAVTWVRYDRDAVPFR